MAAPCCCHEKSQKVSSSCLGRCDLPRHKCLDREDIRPGPIPKNMGWLYTARDSPYHQLRCGWRPGHISCSVLRKIEQHNSSQCGGCALACGRPCYKACCAPKCFTPKCYPSKCFPPKCFPSKCFPPKCFPPKCFPPKCFPPKCFPSKCFPPKCYTPKCPPKCYPSGCPPSPPGCCKVTPCSQPLIRIIRHKGQYSIVTKPSNITNHPSGPYPLKYVLNTDEFDGKDDTAKFSIEAKFNDYHFDYTSSQSSFILDFSPPETKCCKPCPKKSSVCFPCQSDDAKDKDT